MVYYNAKREAERKLRDTPERILEIARKRGYFSVSLRYRDDWLRRRCVKLRKQGLLKGGHRIEHGQFVFYPKQQDKSDEQKSS